MVSTVSIEWRPVLGYEGLYEVSIGGQVRSLPRATTRGKVLAQNPSAGYPAVTLSKAGKVRTRRVHVLVAEAFLGHGRGDEVRHRDGARNDPCVANVEYGTRSDNVHDQVRHGVHGEAARACCDRGHPLVGANLSRSHRPGVRRCLACKRANETVRNGRRRGLVLDPQQVADAHHADIIAGRAPERRRST
jgi:hypothetical protein